MLKFFDLFAGIGAFHLGLSRCGFKYAGSCELDDSCEKVYMKNFGSGFTYRDARLLDTGTMPDFDILTAGFPCQAFSYAGQRMGFADKRGTLFLEIVRIAKQKRPRILFLENVAGLLNHDKGRTFATIINSLHEVGYDVEWQVINGKYFVPQSRERIFIIGHLTGGGTRPIFPIRENNQVSDSSRKETQSKGKRVRDAHTRAIDSNYWKGGSCSSRTMILLAYTNSNMKQRVQERQESWNLDTSKQKIGVIESNQRIRRLTPLECERLMGFPDNFTLTDGVSETNRYRMLGNSIIVPVVEFIGNKLYSILSSHNS